MNILKKITLCAAAAIVAVNLSMSVANAAANEVRIAFFLEWATPNQEAKIKNVFLDMGAHLNALRSYRPDITKGSQEIKELIKDLLPGHSPKCPEKHQDHADIP